MMWMADRIITIDQLLKELAKYNHVELHVHHTWSPNHSHWKKRPDAQYWQDSMRNYHKNTRKFSDICQHVTLTPDGLFITGRPFGRQPASITGYNSLKGGIPFMVEMLGDFDKGKDKFGGKQKENALRLTKWFLDRGKYIRFHRENANKTCPGTGIDKNTFLAEARNIDKKEDSKLDYTRYVMYGRTLKFGMRGADVGEAQKQLKAWGYYTGPIDNEFGPGQGFLNAVKAFQRANGLDPDGSIGPATQNKIKALLQPSKDYKKLYEQAQAKLDAIKKIL